ncbi:hypothetical protein GJR95_24335 [Spirosoma endbachense]|uniref:Uncharacterized protein n=2 Tax=Spirosoma endbachense TaxID=2666025 RepID=A0A6P1VXU6_9BACT|nr:hypothetical protein GJR95_24335 [Spirosoma endbachense]
MDIYANRTRIEGQVADFVECAFRPNTTIDKLKAKIEGYIKTLPEAEQAKFKVTKQRNGSMNTSDGVVEWFRVCVQYKSRWVISVREPLTIL